MFRVFEMRNIPAKYFAQNRRRHQIMNQMTGTSKNARSWNRKLRQNMLRQNFQWKIHETRIYGLHFTPNDFEDWEEGFEDLPESRNLHHLNRGVVARQLR